MKRYISFILLICMLISFSSLNVSANELKIGYKVYTSRGDIYNNPNTNQLSAITCPGAVVYASEEYFNKIVRKGTRGGSFTCYGKDESLDTLTLGCGSIDMNKTKLERIQYQVQSQINYVNDIGGIVTGYTIEDGSSECPALNISWVVGEYNHYARFEMDRYSYTVIGYYDLMYTDDSLVQYDIPYMNESFSVSCESQ